MDLRTSGASETLGPMVIRTNGPSEKITFFNHEWAVIGFKCKVIDYKMSKFYRMVPMIRVEPARVKKYKLIK